MTRFNKILVASQMFVEAHERFDRASRDIDYVTSLMLAGAVCGIVSPLLTEQGKGTFHALLASLYETPPPEGIFRLVYDGFKHAGFKERNVAPSADLVVDADVRKEAAWMLEAAREDYSKIIIERGVLDQLSDEFLKLIREPVDYIEDQTTVRS
jgi:hypothetical protein